MTSRKRLVLVPAALLIIWAVIAPSLATHLIVEKPLVRADAIIVLSGSAVYRERTARAASLYSEGVAPLIYISDDGAYAGWSSGDETNLPFVELEKRELMSQGVPSHAIVVLPGRVSGTDDEAMALGRELDTRPAESIVIVTSAYHSRRALRTFEQILAGRHIDIGITAPPPGLQTPEPFLWWLTPRGWQTVAGEYLKAAVYYAYY